MKKLKSFLFQNRSTNQIIAKNTLWLSLSQVFRKIIKFALIIYAARVLGVNGYGVFSYAIGLAGFFTIFSDIGISGLLIRDFSAEGKISPEKLSTFLYIKFVLISASILLVLFVAPLFSNIPEAIPLISIIAMLIAFDGFKDFTIAIMRSIERMELEASVDILTNLATLIFGLIALFTYKTSLSLAIAYAMGSGLGLLFSLFLLRRYFKQVWKYFNKHLAKKILVDAWPFALIGIFGTIMVSTDIVILGWLGDAESVGLYSAAIKPVQSMYVISSILSISTFPRISKFARNNIKEIRELLEKSISLLFLAGLPIVIGGIILSKEIIETIYGSGYLSSTLTFQILLITIFAVFPMAMLFNVIIANNEQRRFINPLALAAIGNIILNIALIPLYGIVGAAIATVVTQFFAVAMIWIKIKKIIFFTVLPHVNKIFLSTMVMIILTIIMKTLSINFIMNIGLSALAYFVLLSTLKEPLLKEVKQITNR